MSNRSSRRGRRKPHFRRRQAPGTAPGTLNVDPCAMAPVIHVFAYGPDKFIERPLPIGDLGSLPGIVRDHSVTWVNVDGLGDVNVLRQLGEMFGLHSLALEDVVHVHQRAKIEPYGDHLFIVTRMVCANSPSVETEQLSMFLGKNFVLTFQYLPGDSLEPVRQRLRQATTRIRQRGADYLAYCLIDAVIDGYFPILERYGESLDTLEERVMASPTPDMVREIRDVRRDLLSLRRAIWPHREALSMLARDESPLIDPSTQIYLRDCYDHVIQIMDLLEMYRDLGSDLRDVYLSSLSNRMNDVMRVLTVIATIFIPLTFITSIYGMNFDTHWPLNMPELRSPYGYVSVWAVMLTVTGGMLWYFKRKGWLRSLLEEGKHAQHNSNGHDAPNIENQNTIPSPPRS